MKRIIAIMLSFLILICFVGCDDSKDSYSSNDSSYTSEIKNSNDESLVDKNVEPEEIKTPIEQFIHDFNEVSETPISDRKSFDPKDNGSEYYRTEYRLSAWDGSLGEVANIGNSQIEIINYGSYGGFYDNNKLRIYVTTPSVEETLKVFPVIARILDSTVTEDEIQEIIEHVKEYGDKNGLTIGKLSGYIFQKELMLDIS